MLTFLDYIYIYTNTSLLVVFIIGRVTKVLNMKPPEILAMLEEATGTRMYEDKKRETQKTIEKKDSKLAQINQILQEDLEPQMKKVSRALSYLS